MGKFEIYKSKDKWYFRLKAGNGEIIAQSEAYNTKQGAMKGVASVQQNAKIAMIQIVDKKEKVILKSKELVKQLVKTEKYYANEKEPEVKPEIEKEDEYKVLVVNPSVKGKRWKRISPTWM